MSNEQKNVSKNKNVQQEKLSLSANLFEWIEMLVLCASLILLVFTFVVRPARVDGQSMENTLHDGEMLMISNLTSKPKYGDIIVFQKINCPGHSSPIVKRVIAVEGETVDIDFDTWIVTVADKDGNVRTLDESAYRKLATDARVTTDLQFPITVGKDQYFVMGDNRNHSLDSRNSMIGLVDKNEIIGKVLFRFFPFDKFGTIN